MPGFLTKLLGATGKELDSVISVIRDVKDFNAGVAACALVGGSDGDWDDDEVAATIKGLKGHKAFQAFADKVTKQVTDFEPLATTRGGRAQLREYVQAIRGSTNAKSIFFTAVDVADATGGIGKSEMAMLAKIADDLGLTGDKDVQEVLNEPTSDD